MRKLKPAETAATSLITNKMMGVVTAYHTGAIDEDEAVARLSRETASMVSHLPKEQGRKLLLRELELTQQLLELRDRIDENETNQQQAQRDFERMLPEFLEKWREAQRRARLVTVPSFADTANNAEVSLMGAAYVLDPFTHFDGMNDREQAAAVSASGTMVAHLAQKDAAVLKVITAARVVTDGAHSHGDDDPEDALHVFSVSWFRSGFAKLEIGHKLAASLAMTDAPDDIEIKAPWAAWSLVVPPGLLHETHVDDGSEAGRDAIARVWCLGSEPLFFVNHRGQAIGPLSRDMFAEDAADSESYAYGKAIAVALDCLVRGACLALSNPEDFRRQSTREKSSTHKNGREGVAPDFGVTRFMLSAPVTIDMRQHLLDTIDMRQHLLDTIHGKKGGGGAPTVQFLVRGHWRNQSHGPRHSLRKTIWVSPFWKGDEEARVLLRNYRVKQHEDKQP